MVSHGAVVIAGFVLVAFLAALVLLRVLFVALAKYNEKLYLEMKAKYREEYAQQLRNLQQNKQDDDILRALREYRSESDLR